VCASDVVVSVVVDKQSLAVVKGQTLSFDAPNKIKKTTTIKSNTYSYSSVTDSSSSYDVVLLNIRAVMIMFLKSMASILVMSILRVLI
jgi:hypothetical protein